MADRTTDEQLAEWDAVIGAWESQSVSSAPEFTVPVCVAARELLAAVESERARADAAERLAEDRRLANEAVRTELARLLDEQRRDLDRLADLVAERDALKARIDAVRKLHVPTDGEWCCEAEECAECAAGGAHEGLICDLCTDHSLSEMSRVAVWPCETARILDGEAVDRTMSAKDRQYVVVQPQIVGSPTSYRHVYYSDLRRHNTRAAAIRHGFKQHGHDDWLIAIVEGNRLVLTAWMDEDRPDEANERDEMADQLGWEIR